MNHPFHFFPEKETGLNIDIIFYPVNNIVAAIWNIYSLKLKNIYFLFFNTERLQQFSHIVCVPVPRLSQPCRNFYQFHVFSVHTSQGRLCPSMCIQKSLQGRDNLPCGRGVVCPSKCTDTHNMVLASWSSWILFSVFSIHSLYFSPHCLFSC